MRQNKYIYIYSSLLTFFFRFKKSSFYIFMSIIFISFTVSLSIMSLNFFSNLNFNSSNLNDLSYEISENSLTATLSHDGDLILNKS